MIKQKSIIIKTASAALTYPEMGDIVCNSSSYITITLPSPNTGLWYRLSNAGTGIVSVSDGSSILTTLKQTEQCLCLANGTSGWFFSKGGGGSEYTLPQATETVLGGIKAVAKTSAETSEVKIDTGTGKLYVTPPDAAANGIPAGGTAGQILSKKDGTDYNTEWIDNSGGVIPLSGTTAQRPQATETDEYTKLLLHFDSDFKDCCGHTVTPYYNSAISSAQSKFGNGSVYFDGSQDYIKVTNSSDFAFGTNNFTVDCWIRFITTPIYATIMESRASDGTDGFHLGCNADGNFDKRLHLRTGSVNYVGPTVMNADTWYHVAVVGEGNKITVYLNGAVEIQITLSYNFTSQMCIIGTHNGGFYCWNGYIDEFRISKGIARWTTEFTPPDSEYIWESTGLTVGLQYFDTTLNKPIWSNGVTWIDATGASA